MARDLCGFTECYPAWIYSIMDRALYELLALLTSDFKLPDMLTMSTSTQSAALGPMAPSGEHETA